ncbi:hypothetical protein IT774_04290 [Salinimonas marina]|uniref:Glycosyltransferase subfamily 4-like N-terminal domain-containing protein n=2 Tax=Salinimonas marina TaxID=2785918 RepID=A0A7S9DYP0_9ALTE|nr:hypothetical protein IT774_04290 [Salinimonas marina]
MAALLEADYIELSTTKKGFSRYVECIKRTFKVLRNGHYDVVFAQNPSLILVAVAVFLKLFFGFKLIIDAHNAGVRPKEGRSVALNKVNLFLLKRADAVIVTNEQLKCYLENHNVNAVVFTDPLPSLAKPKSLGLNNFVFVICSWSEDEPIREYIQVAKQRDDLNFVFSGNYKKYFSDTELASLPENIKLPGFVAEDEYAGLVVDAKVVLDLTTRDDCLVCGAYEAISANKKVILSDTKVNKDLFGDAAFYTKNNSTDLNMAIDTALRTDIDAHIKQFKSDYNATQVNAKQNVFATL